MRCSSDTLLSKRGDYLVTSEIALHGYNIRISSLVKLLLHGYNIRAKEMMNVNESYYL